MLRDVQLLLRLHRAFILIVCDEHGGPKTQRRYCRAAIIWLLLRHSRCLCNHKILLLTAFPVIRLAILQVYLAFAEIVVSLEVVHVDPGCSGATQIRRVIIVQLNNHGRLLRLIFKILIIDPSLAHLGGISLLLLGGVTDRLL